MFLRGFFKVMASYGKLCQNRKVMVSYGKSCQIIQVMVRFKYNKRIRIRRDIDEKSKSIYHNVW